jgi:ribosomal protein L13E
MNPKSLFALTLAAAGLVLSQASLNAQDTTVQPAPPSLDTPPADNPQGPPPAGRKHGREGYRLAELTEKLGLTADEQKVIGPIIDSARSQGKEVRDDQSLSREDRRAKMKGIMEAARTQIRAALTPDQQKLFDALPTRGEKPQAQAPGGGAPQAPSTPPPAPPST